MKYIFVDESWEDYLYWQKTDKKKLKRINDLLKDISRNPFEGIGKPEPLKHKYSGFWSRRIDDEHRLIYRYEEGEIQIAKSTAKEKAHLQSAPPKPKTAKELFTSFLSPPLKKYKFPSTTPTYFQLIEQKSTAYNIVLLKIPF